MKENPKFTFINYAVCNYCVHQVRAAYRDGYVRGCGLVQNEEGQYARLTMFKEEMDRVKASGGDAISELTGCTNFEASGLPAHPSVKKVLVRRNPLASSIPEDPSATQTSWDLEEEIDKYPQRKIDLLVIENGQVYRTIQ